MQKYVRQKIFSATIFSLLILFLLACQLFNFNSNNNGTTTPNSAATIAALVTTNTQLAIQLATSNARLDAALQLPGQVPSPYLPPPIFTATPPILPTPFPAATPTLLLFYSPTPLPVVYPSPTFTPFPVTPRWIVTNIMYSPKLPYRLYALQTKQAGQEYRLMISSDYGKSWSHHLGNWPVNSGCINRLTLNRHIPEHFYLSTCQGIYHWGGAEWLLKFSKVTEMVAGVAEQPELLWATEPYGPSDVPVIRTFNSQTWTPASRYLSHSNGVANLLVDPRDPERLYAVVWPGYFGSYLRRGAANGQWATLPTPLNNSPIGINIIPDGTSGKLYVVTNGTQLWRSSNPNAPNPDDVRWTLVYTFEDGQRATLLGSSWPANQLVLFANIEEDAAAIPYFSLDQGKSWAVLPVSLN